MEPGERRAFGLFSSKLLRLIVGTMWPFERAADKEHLVDCSELRGVEDLERGY